MQNLCIQKQWMFTCQRMKLDPYITLHTNFNSKGIEDFIDKPINTNLLEEKTGRNFYDISCNSDSLDVKPKAQSTKQMKSNRIISYVKKKKKVSP